MFILKHRSMTPSLYIGEGTLVSKASDAMLFDTLLNAEKFLKDLGTMGLMYHAVPKLEVIK